MTQLNGIKTCNTFTDKFWPYTLRRRISCISHCPEIRKNSDKIIFRSKSILSLLEKIFIPVWPVFDRIRSVFFRFFVWITCRHLKSDITLQKISLFEVKIRLKPSENLAKIIGKKKRVSLDGARTLDLRHGSPVL